jgi:glucose 1-dehydrogenase
MKAITVVPGKPNQVQVSEQPDPQPESGSLPVQGRLLGICGTDVDIVENGYGWPPPGRERLVIGHESLGAVLDAPDGSGFSVGDLVAGIVRRPDPVPCEPYSHGEWDFCRNGQYTERGIKELDGYGAQLWRVGPDFAIQVDPSLGDCGVLLEPASVLAKAWSRAPARSACSRPYSSCSGTWRCTCSTAPPPDQWRSLSPTSAPRSTPATSNTSASPPRS